MHHYTIHYKPESVYSASSLLQDLCRLPHRGAATPQGTEAARLLQSYLTEMGAQVRTESFQTPRTYLTIVYWLIGGLLVSLALIPVSGVAVGLVLYFTVMAWRYFNWNYSFITRFPVQHTASNVIGSWSSGGPIENRRKVILMAHYDTAPVSLLYSPKQQTNFRVSLIISLWLMGFSVGIAALEALKVGLPYVQYARYGLMAYFGLQAVMGTLGYWLHGYTNGASDNATGVAAALATAERLTDVNLPDLDIEVVLTSAEEVGMIGAYSYVEAHKREWKRPETLAINFDTLGAGKLTVIEQTGTVERIRYDNTATQLARQLLVSDRFSERAQIGRWHTADFDSVWFVRNRIPVLALCALDDQGQMPRIHQTADTLEQVETGSMHDAIDLAEAVVLKWMTNNG
ncbi:M28 family metallopeptidase [Spirosoma aerolatum]|uniref:M28 family metallopeptidase n=1 Tax=Spirosoma aerolatum TaxID=1211326 RepID=UPI0009AE2E5B|nr:M20/M25/M40 family metallo-hydrolase [Spirosoma aerolatum]